jgi:hypothetical protein
MSLPHLCFPASCSVFHWAWGAFGVTPGIPQGFSLGQLIGPPYLFGFTWLCTLSLDNVIVYTFAVVQIIVFEVV